MQTSAITVSLSPAAPQTINQAQQLGINATLTNDTSNKGVMWSLSPAIGSLNNQTTSAATYVARYLQRDIRTVRPALRRAAADHRVPSGAGANVAALTVDAGPVPAQQTDANSIFTSAPDYQVTNPVFNLSPQYNQRRHC